MKNLEQNIDLENMPQHVAIIMDGNGRWAKQQGKMRIFGHQNALKAVRSSVNFAASHHIKVLTLYAFSSENWNRPENEVNALMQLFMTALNNEVKKLHKNNICLKVIGNKFAFNKALQQKIHESEKLTQNNTGLILNIAANYGGMWDITQSAKNLASKVITGEMSIDDIHEKTLESNLVTGSQPQVDLLIRTSGEQRISNFLLWQSAYAEFFFTSVLWPDFNEEVFTQAVLAYQKRERRFGGCEEMHNHK